MNASEALSAGLKAVPNKVSSFASTQAAWRFYKNEAVTLSKLQEPLTAAAHAGIQQQCGEYALCVHDWSKLRYRHRNKPDIYPRTHSDDLGYELQTSLILSDQTGNPIAPVAQLLLSADGSYATYGDDAAPNASVQNHLDEVSDCIAHLEQQNFARPLVHVMDREADSIGHMRRWEADGIHWLVRAKGNPTVELQGTSMACKAVADKLEYRQAHPGTDEEKKRRLWIAEAEVTLRRPAKPYSKNGKRTLIPGPPVTARLVVSRLLSDLGEVEAEWLLLSNVKDIDASTIALWYYWRWKIETFFKLMKSAGHQLEAWQQESALAIAKRLLVASMACVTVWAIAADESQEVAELRGFLVKLSGRQMRHQQTVTHPALLAGLWVFLSLFELMQSYSPHELERFRKTAQNLCSKDV